MSRLLMLTCLIVLAACQPDNSPAPLVGTLERDRLELIAEARERIDAILVTEGETVDHDQLLVRLDPSVYAAQLAELEAGARRAERFLAELIRGPRAERISQAQARLDGAREDLATQQKSYQRIVSLREAQLASQADLDRAYNNKELAEAAFEQAKASLDELLDGTTIEELDQARADLARAQAAVARSQLTLARLDIRAPRPGVIESLPYKLGERPPPGAPVVVMLAEGAPYARVYIPEPLRARVTPGVAATIRVDGIEAGLAGQVRYVARDATYTPYYALTQRDRSRLAFLAEITLTDRRARDLPSGVPVQVEFPSLP